jgi:protein-tyrosine phosphatase
MAKLTRYIDTNSTDYSIVHYTFDIYTKANCLIKYYSPNKDIFEANEIITGVYLGNINSVYDIEKLKSLGITHIISVIEGFIPPYPDDFNYLVINALDTQNTDLFDTFDVSGDFIDDAIMDDSKILIHCQAGRSRSATILAAYIIKTFGIEVGLVISLIKNKRSIIEPNKYFVSQLENYYAELFNA